MKNTRQNKFYLLIIITLTSLTLSCAEKRVELLSKRLNSYWEGMQWRAVGNLSAMVDEQNRADHLNRLAKKLDNVRLVDFNIVNISMDKEKNKATAVINYSYYTLEENNLHSTQELQSWYFHNKNGWLLDTTP